MYFEIFWLIELDFFANDSFIMAIIQFEICECIIILVISWSLMCALLHGGMLTVWIKHQTVNREDQISKLGQFQSPHFASVHSTV